MRTFTIASFILVAFFGVSPFASAQTGTGAVTQSGNNTGTGAVQTTGSTYGQTQSQGSNVTLINPLKGVDCSRGNGNCLSAFLLNILDFVINIGSIVVILMLVYVGFKFVVAQGVPGKIEEARTMLLWTVIGALVLLGSKAIAMSVQATVSALGG